MKQFTLFLIGMMTIIMLHSCGTYDVGYYEGVYPRYYYYNTYPRYYYYHYHPSQYYHHYHITPRRSQAPIPRHNPPTTPRRSQPMRKR